MTAKFSPRNNVTVVTNGSTKYEVAVDVYRQGNFTIAESSLVVPYKHKDGSKTFTVYRSLGSSLKNEEDRENKVIGEKIAIARALGKLRSMIISDTMEQVHQRCKGNNYGDLSSLPLVVLEDLEKDIQEEKRSRLSEVACA